jgi:hypothetical protein
MKELAATKRLARRRRVGSMLIDEQGEKMKSESEVEVDGAEADANTLAARLAPVFAHHVEYYAKEWAGSGEDPREHAEAMEEYHREHIAETPPMEIKWEQLAAVAREDLGAALELWEKIRQAAREEIATGQYVREKIFPNSRPGERATQYALREEMADGWKPQNGIEHALIDMLSLTYNLWIEWTAIVQQRTNDFAVKPKTNPYTYNREWKQPRFDEGMATDQAVRLADGYNRQFLRVLRQLRDLRRYTPPVIVNNGGQVNVAANGGQQVNVTQPEG